MAGLRILYADPNVVRIDTPDRLWFVSGHPWATAPALDTTATDGSAEAALCRRLGDAAVARVDLVGGAPRTLRLWKGASSSHDLYYTVRPDGDVVVSDHFRNVACAVPASERGPSDDAVVDHFLFRHIRGRGTYSRNVHRPGHGEVVTIDLANGAIDIEAFDRLDSRGAPAPIEEHIDRLDRALDDVTADLRTTPGVVGMLSGGPDSTLLGTYLGRGVPILHVAPDSDRFHLGGRHLDEARRALEVDPIVARVPAEGFVEHLEEAVDRRGVPPHFPHWVTLTQVFPQPFGTFVFGERASMLQRSGGIAPHRARPFSTWPGSLAQPLFRAAAARSERVGLRLLAAQSASLGHDPFSPRGWASQISVYADAPLIERAFGTEAVTARLAARIAYARSHIELLPTDADRYVRHLELASWMAFFNENVAQGFRQLALAYGRTAVDPFITKPVMDAILSVPPSERFCQGAKSKYLIERLLHQRLPAYPPGQPKDRIVLPFARYYTEGPLRRIWERYAIPDLFTGDDRARLVDRPTDSTWNAITWAVWEQRIAKAPTLEPTPTSIDLRWTSTVDEVTPR